MIVGKGVEDARLEALQCGLSTRFLSMLTPEGMKRAVLEFVEREGEMSNEEALALFQGAPPPLFPHNRRCCYY